jgi:demethylmenaquinone methyltransferase/2-methoxy-6-polyprenyl-1,4-benzoquinol methylase
LSDQATVLPPATRGLLVEGRCATVDPLENILSFGRQETILQATLDAAELRDGESLVDVGCGTGKLAVAATRTTSDVLGIDATPGMIDLATERAAAAGSPARFEVGVGEALPLADGSVDAVTSSYFLHHLPSDVKRQALAECGASWPPAGGW